MSSRFFRDRIVFGAILLSLGDSNSQRFFVLDLITLALWMGDAGAELDSFVVICNTSCFLCIDLLWFGSFWLMRGLRSTGIGEELKIFSIFILSLASGGVMHWPRVVCVEGG